MSKFCFTKKLAFNHRGKYFDDNPVFSDFYENKYLELNPNLHIADSVEKIKIAVNAIDFLIENKRFRPIKLVDIGSGSMLVASGVMDYLRKLKSNNPICLAVDISGAILQRTDFYPGIIKLRADASNLPIGDRDFDLMIMFDLIEHTNKPDLVIREALRVAKYTLIKIPLERSLYTYLRGGKKRLMHLELKFGHVQHFKRSDIIKILNSRARIIKESYEIIPNRSIFIEALQRFLLNFKLNAIFRFIFGGFIVLLISNNNDLS